MILNTLRNLFMAKHPLPIPYSCGSAVDECIGMEISIIRHAVGAKLHIQHLHNHPLRISRNDRGVWEALLVRVGFDPLNLPSDILFRGYGASRIEALKDLYDSMLEGAK